jgi:hypothetical protein
MTTRSDKIKDIVEKLRIAQATAFVCQKALTHGKTDLELYASDLLESHREALTACYDDLASLAQQQEPRSPKKPAREPVLRVVESEGAPS